MDLARDIVSLPVWKEVDAVLAVFGGGERSRAGGRADRPTEGTTFVDDTEATPTAAGGAPIVPTAAPLTLCDLFVVLPSPRPAGAALDDAQCPRLTVFALVSQAIDSYPNMSCSLVTLRIYAVEKGRHYAEPSAASLTLHVEVPGYDMERCGHFRQLLVCASGRGAFLLAPRCCAAVAVPELNDEFAAQPREQTVRAVPLMPPSSAEFVKVLWHPLSDAHVGILLSDGTWQLLNLSYRAASVDPEVSFVVSFGDDEEPGERVADFAFAGRSLPVSGGEAVWLAASVLFMSTRGRISLRSPVLPSITVFPKSTIHALSTAGSTSCGDNGWEWLRRTVLCRTNQSEVAVPGVKSCSYISVRHPLHMHGDSEEYYQRWSPAEQLIAEDRVDGELSSPRSPRQRGDFCSVHIVAHSPVTVVARSTSTGLIEVLVLNGALAPEFERRGIEQRDTRSVGSPSEEGALVCAVFEEIDLAQGPKKSPTILLSPALLPPEFAGGGGGALFLARSRGLVVAIHLPWLTAFFACSGGDDGGAPVEDLPPATVTTLVEVRAADGPLEIAGWQLLPQVLSARDATAVDSAGVTTEPPLIGLWLQVQGPGAPVAGRPGAAATGSSTSAVAGEEGQAAASQLCAGSAAAALRSVDVRAAIRAGDSRRAAAAGTRSTREEKASPHPRTERDEYLRHLAAPVLLSRPVFGSAIAEEQPSATAIAKAVAAAQSGPLGDLSVRQFILKHLTTQIPTRVAAVKAELTELRLSGEALRESSAETERKFARICERQREIERKREALADALKTELEVRELDGVAADELPRLWSQLHDLRQAFELLRAAAATSSSGLEAPATAVSPCGIAQELAGHGVQWLATVEELQRSWTDTSSDRLRRQADELEAAVAAVQQRRAVVAAEPAAAIPTS